MEFPVIPSLPTKQPQEQKGWGHTLVVQRPQEGVPVRSLEESVLDLHLPPAQLLAASKSLGQLQDALPLVHLLLDGVEALLHGFGGRSQPGALQERNR